MIAYGYVKMHLTRKKTVKPRERREKYVKKEDCPKMAGGVFYGCGNYRSCRLRRE